MCKPLKKIAKGIGKVFKKVTKVVKKVVKSDIFKAVAVGAALYFGGAALFSSAAKGAAASGGTAATKTAAAASMKAGASAAGYKSAAFKAFTTGQNAASAVSGLTGSQVLGNVAGAVAKAGSTVGSWAQANPLLASTALKMGGQVVSNYAQAEEEEDMRRELYKRNTTQLDSLGSDLDQINSRFASNRQSQNSTPENIQTSVSQQNTDSQPLLAAVQRQTAGSQPINVEKPKRGYYDNSENTWKTI